MAGQLIAGLNGTYIVSVVVNNLIISVVYPKNFTSLCEDSYKQLCVEDAKQRISATNKEGSSNDN